MTENMKKFLEAVRDSDELQKKLQEAGKEGTADIAKEAGFTLTDEDISSVGKGELQDDELEGVAGGMSIVESGFDKFGFHVTLSDAEVKLFNDAGYVLLTNWTYSPGDYYEIQAPSGFALRTAGEVTAALNRLKGIV